MGAHGSDRTLECNVRAGLLAGERRDPMIHATCHTAGNIRCLEFDATPWFSEADVPSIIDLAQQGWASTRLRTPSKADEDTKACMTSLRMW